MVKYIKLTGGHRVITLMDLPIIPGMSGDLLKE